MQNYLEDIICLLSDFEAKFVLSKSFNFASSVIYIGGPTYIE